MRHLVASIIFGTIALLAIGYGLSRGAISSHDIVHDTPALIAYIIACICGTTAGTLLGTYLKDE